MKAENIWRGIISAIVVNLFFGGIFFLGFRFGVGRSKKTVEAAEHHVFYAGRPRVFVGDDNVEVEVFKDQDGSWVALVWERGKCWQGKLTRRLK